LFEAAERLARERGIGRSALYAEALEAYLAANDLDPITEAISCVCEDVDTSLDPALARLQAASLDLE